MSSRRAFSAIRELLRQEFGFLVSTGLVVGLACLKGASQPQTTSEAKVRLDAANREAYEKMPAIFKGETRPTPPRLL